MTLTKGVERMLNALKKFYSKRRKAKEDSIKDIERDHPYSHYEKFREDILLRDNLAHYHHLDPRWWG